VLLMGKTSDPVCEIDVEQNKIGLILLGGLNPMAAASEIGIEAENHSMSTVVEYDQFVNYQDVLNEASKDYSLTRS
jgi:HTH-type transcriptional regulator, global nitrogen regulator NrpRI